MPRALRRPQQHWRRQCFLDVAFVSSKAELEEVVADPANRAVVKDLARLAGEAPTANDQADVQKFATAAEEEAGNWRH